jgi:hypothetical protein
MDKYGIIKRNRLNWGGSMNRNILKTLAKCLIFGVILAIVLYFLGNILTKKDMFKELESALFFEGIISIIIGLFSAMSGNPNGLSLQGSGSNNAGYISHMNIEVTKHEREKVKVKTDFILGISSLSLIIGGVITIIISYLI